MFPGDSGRPFAFTAIILIAANQIIGSVEEERGEDPRQRHGDSRAHLPVGNVMWPPSMPRQRRRRAVLTSLPAPVSRHGAGVPVRAKIGDKAAWSTAAGGRQSTG